MRFHILAIFTMCALTLPLRAQTTNQLPVGTYAFTVAVPVIECNLDGTNLKNEAQAPQGAKFYYLQSADSDRIAVIQFLLWAESSPAYKTFNASADKTGGSATRKYFCLPRSRFDRYSQKVYATGWGAREFAAGALILPFKLRPGTGGQGIDFTKDVTFGTAAGPRVRINERHETYLSALIGVGLSSVTLTEANTGGKVTTTTDRSAFTFTIGTMLEIDKFQMGAFIGQDRISQPNQGDWIHQGKTWLAVGLGYTLFGSDKGKEASDQTSNQPAAH